MPSSRSSRRAEGRRFFRWVVAPVFGLVLLLVAGGDVGPAWTAHRGGGVRGSFVAEWDRCRRGSDCTWYGTFTSADGSVSRHGVTFAGAGRFVVGATVPAVDTGSPQTVYPVGGGDDWILDTGLLVAAAGLLASWAFGVLRAAGRRRRGRRDGASGAGGAAGPMPRIS